MKDILYFNTVEDIRLIDTLRILKEHDYSKDYLTFEALEDGTFTYTICSGNDPEMEDTPIYASAELQYSFNGEDWFNWARPHLTSESITVLANQKLYVRGYTQPTSYVDGTVKFSSTCRFNVCGLLSSLLYGYDYYADKQDFILTKQPMEATHFSGLFINCDKLISAENLILPQELVYSCYTNMFQDCTSLTIAPKLPATTLAGQCYTSMFYRCTSLTTAPELPATTLTDGCYYYMFSGCSRLNYIKAMFITTPSTTYTYGWVDGVAATGTFVKNVDATWTTTGNNGVPTGWTVETADS